MPLDNILRRTSLSKCCLYIDNLPIHSELSMAQRNIRCRMHLDNTQHKKSLQSNHLLYYHNILDHLELCMIVFAEIPMI